MSSNLVVLQASDLQQLNFLHQGSTRLKVVCFDLSPTFILLGANSGTIYVLDHETLHLKKQIPAGNGSVMQLSISPDEQQVACALSCGTVLVFELQQANTQLLTSSSEHRGQVVTTMVWASWRPELYIGDASGQVTMLYASKSKTASLFRSSCLHLMTLESSIIQLDYQESYLLVSTLTHSYVCNTSSETFCQVGTKLRQGEYGSCFCQVNYSGTSSTHRETWEGIEDLQVSSDKFGLSDCYEVKEEQQAYHNSGLRRERPSRPASPVLMSHVFCARPGTRIWEADHSGKVLVTHQLKGAIIVPPAEVLLTDGSFREQQLLEEITPLPQTDYPTDKPRKISTCHEPAQSKTAGKATHPPISVAFTKMMSFYNKYLLAISAYGFYIIDPATSKVLLWVSVSEGITDVKVSGNSLIHKSGNGCIQNFMITTVDSAIFLLHTRKLFLECASLCLKYTDTFAKSELLSRLGAKILTDLRKNIMSDIIKERIKDLKSLVGMDKERNHTMNLTKISGVTYIKNKSFEADEIKANLNIALKKNHSFMSNMTVTRWSSEPRLGGSKKEWEQLPSAQDTTSMESNLIHQEPKKITANYDTSIDLHEGADSPASADTLPSRSPENLNSTSHMYSAGSGPNHYQENINTPSSDLCSQQSDVLSPQKSFESSMDMYEDPLFTPEDSPSPDHEAVSRIPIERHPPTALSYASQNFYNLAYAPIHPGSEAATLLQDLMENVTTNMVDTFTSGTRTLTERLKGVVPFVYPEKDIEEVTSESEITINHHNTDPNDLPILIPLKNTEVSDDFPAAIVIDAKSRKKKPQKQSSVGDASDSIQVDLEETVPRPELAGMVKNLHELVCTTMQQMTTTNNPEEAQDLLSHWFEVFCHTVQEIQHNNTYSSLPPSEDQTGEGPVSLSSIESSHSLGSADTSSDSLNWDSSDIGFEPSSLSIDILEKITGLFLESLQAGVTTSKFQLSGTTAQKTDLPQHPMTPSEVSRRDALYAQVIASDCGLLQYSHLLNSLESLGHHYYLLTWAALMEKITRNSNTLLNQPLPDIIPDLEFTRAQWVSILQRVASSGSTKNLIMAAAQIESPVVIQDVIFLLQYMTTHPIQMNSSLTRTQIPKLLLQYLIEFSHNRSLTKAYLDSWCHYSELQGDILCALLSVTRLVPSHFSCKCGLPLPLRRYVALEVLEETVLLHDIVDPKGLAELCQSLGYWKGYCAISLAYSLQPHILLFPYILQTCNADLLNDFLEVLHYDDFGMAFTTLARISSKDTSIILCFRCQSKISFPKRECIIEDSRTTLNNTVAMNGDSHLTENSFNESCPMEARSKTFIDDQIPIQKAAAVEGINHLWEMVVAKVLCRSGAANTLKLLTSVQDTIPPGIISKRVFRWCILASLAEQRGPKACWAVLDSLCGAKTKLFSHKVFQAIHRHPSQKCHNNQADDMPSTWLSRNKPFSETAQNGIHPPPTSITLKDPQYPVPLGHHWGVWTEVLEGVCSCCYLQLSTQALMSVGGITVFSCSHAFHTICLSHQGYECVICAQLQSSTAAH